MPIGKLSIINIKLNKVIFSIYWLINYLKNWVKVYNCNLMIIS